MSQSVVTAVLTGTVGTKFKPAYTSLERPGVSSSLPLFVLLILQEAVRAGQVNGGDDGKNKIPACHWMKI
jgi:hypothetical protein